MDRENPFQHYKLKEEHNKAKDHLTKPELDTLIGKQMPNERLERIRDVFVFCCLTGLAFTDVDHLRKEHLSTDEYGTIWIHKPREKTAVMSRIPLLPHPIELLRKYEYDTELLIKAKLLPVPSNQKMNSYLKEQHRQESDDTLRSPYVRLPCDRVWDADRHYRQDSRSHQYEYDAALCKNLREQYKPGNGKNRAGYGKHTIVSALP